MKPELTLETEFDQMLAPIKRKVFYTIGALVLILVPFEAILIFGFLADSGKLSLQTFHGFAVGLGGLVIFAVSMLLVLLPTKLMGYKAYQMSARACELSEQAAKAASDMATRVNETSERVNSFVVEGREAISELKKSVSGLQLNEFRLSFERKIDELKDKIDETLGANDPADPEALAAAQARMNRKAGA